MAVPSKIDALLSVDEVAQILGVPYKTLYQWRSRGDGPPSFRVGRYVRYQASDVERWIAGRGRRGGVGGTQ